MTDIAGGAPEVARSQICHTLDEVLAAAEGLGYPVVVRPSFTMGGVGSGFAHDEAELRQIAGAGLDVYEFEPKVHPGLLEMENVTLLPHLGTAALEVREAMGMMALNNVIAFAEGRPVPNPV